MTKTTLIAILTIASIAALITSSSIAFAAQDTLKPKDLAKSFFDVFTQKGYTVDSFFDVFTELQKSTAISDSFFDVFTELGYTTDSFFDVFTELRTADSNLQGQIDAILDSSSSSDVKIYMTIQGQLGNIEGSSTDPGHEGEIKVNSYSHDLVSPRDSATGQATGKRQHSPVVITKEIDKSTPLLFRAITTNENLSDVTLNFYRPNPSDNGQPYFTVKLTDVQISRASQYPPDPGHSDDYESIAFVFHTIKWTWVDGGISAEDDWEAPVV
jgi:type VI secretion system secreted protein Hcp